MRCFFPHLTWEDDVVQLNTEDKYQNPYKKSQLNLNTCVFTAFINHTNVLYLRDMQRYISIQCVNQFRPIHVMRPPTA